MWSSAHGIDFFWGEEIDSFSLTSSLKDPRGRQDMNSPRNSTGDVEVWMIWRHEPVCFCGTRKREQEQRWRGRLRPEVSILISCSWNTIRLCIKFVIECWSINFVVLLDQIYPFDHRQESKWIRASHHIVTVFPFPPIRWRAEYHLPKTAGPLGRSQRVCTRRGMRFWGILWDPCFPICYYFAGIISGISPLLPKWAPNGVWPRQ